MKTGKKVSLNKLLFKCFFRSGKMALILILISFLCSMLISGTWTIYSAGKTKRIENATTLYGKYQVSVQDISQNVVDKILSNENKISEYSIYKSSFTQNEQGFQQMYYVNPDYFNLSQMNLKYGSFPQKKNDVIIDDLYAYEKGKTADQMIGTSISLNGSDYTVVGVLTNAEFDYVGIVTHTFVMSYDFADKQEQLTMDIKTDSLNYSNIVDRLKSNYGLKSDQVAVNSDVLNYAGVDTSGNPTGFESTIFKIVVILIGILSTFLLYTLTMVFIRKLNSTTSICMALGINFYRIFTTVIAYASVVILIGYSCANILSSIIVSKMFNLSIFENIRNSANLLSILILSISFVCVVIFSALSVLTKNVERVSQNMHNSFMVKAKVKNKPFKQNRFLFLSLAKGNLTVVKSRVFLYVVIIILSGTLFSVSTYAINTYKESTAPISGFDYQLEFKYNSYAEMFTGNKKHEELYKKIDESFGKDKYSVFNYSTFVSVDKNKISNEHAEFLKQIGTDFSIAMNNPSTKRISIPFTVMYADETTLKRFGAKDNEVISLADNECISLINTIKFMGVSYPVNLKTGDTISINLPNDNIKEPDNGEPPQLKFQDIKVVGNVDSLNLDIDTLKNVPIIFVNKAMFDKIAPNTLNPSFVLFDRNEAEPEKVRQFFNGAAGVQLTDLTEANRISNEYFSIFDSSISTALSALLIFLAIIMSITTFLRYDESKSQYAILRAIGIDTSKVMRIFMYEAAFIGLVSSAILIPISIFGSYIVYIIIRRDVVFFFYTIPYKPIAIPVIAFILVSIISYIPAIVKMKCEPIVEVIKSE